MNKWKAQSLPSVGARKQGEQRQCENEKTHARRPFLASEMALERREVPRPLFHLRLFDAASCSFRKGAGSIIATKARVHAASRFLRHADIQVTSTHYADHKERVTVDMDALLHPGNVIAMQPDGQSAKPMVKAQRKRTLSK